MVMKVEMVGYRSRGRALVVWMEGRSEENFGDSSCSSESGKRVHKS